MKNIKDYKGITLIALVITIIVLLILAGVTIALLLGENGILNQANSAKEETEIAKLKEEAKLDMQDTYLQTMTVGEYKISSTDPNFSDWETDGQGTITAYKGDLTEVVIPSKIGNEVIKKIGDRFNNIFGDKKDNITKVTISKGIETINGSLFRECRNLNKIIIPDTVIEMQMSSTFTRTNISSLIIPNSLTEFTMNSTPFYQCNNLREIKLSENITKIPANFFSDTGLYKLELPNKVEDIGVCGVWNCPDIEEIYIPASVETTAWGSIGNCPKLKKVYCEAESKPAGWNNSWLYNCPNAEVVWGYHK